MASVTALAGVPLVGHYAAAKAGVLSLTKTLALELRPGGLGPERRIRASHAACLLGELQILQHHGGGEARGVIAVRRGGGHRAGHGAIGCQRPALAGGFRGDVEQRLMLKPELLAERKGLRDGDHRNAQDHVVADLCGLAIAGAAFFFMVIGGYTIRLLRLLRK